MNLVSVIITTHGRLESLKLAVNSVKSQTYKDIELIVIDDCSEDGTQEWAKTNLINDIYIYIPKEKSKGGNHARNVGIENANGKYIAFLDDDDIWYPSKIEQQVNLLENDSDMVMAYCGHRKVYETGRNILSFPNARYKGDLSELVFSMVFCTTSMIMIKKAVLEEAGVFDENLKFWQEYDLVIRICQCGTIGYIDDILVDILQSASDPSRLSTKIEGWLLAVEYVNKKYSDKISSLSESLKNERLLMIYNDAANRCAIAKDMKRHKQFLKKAWEVDRSLKHWLKYKFNITNYQMDLLKGKISRRQNNGK